MRMIHIVSLIVGLLVFPGCGADVDVQAPGVDVKIDKEEGVQIQAPGVDVKVNKEEGVDVKTPGTDVEVKPTDKD